LQGKTKWVAERDLDQQKKERRSGKGRGKDGGRVQKCEKSFKWGRVTSPPWSRGTGDNGKEADDQGQGWGPPGEGRGDDVGEDRRKPFTSPEGQRKEDCAKSKHLRKKGIKGGGGRHILQWKGASSQGS